MTFDSRATNTMAANSPTSVARRFTEFVQGEERGAALEDRLGVLLGVGHGAQEDND